MINESSITLLNIIDVAFILAAFYVFFAVLKRTQIQNITSVIIILVGSYSISKMIGLAMFSWFIERFFVVFIVFIMIIFQNEIRRASEKIREENSFFIQSQSCKTAITH